MATNPTSKSAAALARALLRALSIAMVAAPALLVGCGGGLQTKSTVPVTIEVHSQGKPAEGAQVTLHPQSDAEGFHLVRPRGIVAKDGIVHLSTYETNDGAPEGEYAVTVIWTPPQPPGASDDDKVGPDKLGGRYADAAKTSLKASVRRDSTETIKLQVK